MTAVNHHRKFPEHILLQLLEDRFSHTFRPDCALSKQSFRQTSIRPGSQAFLTNRSEAASSCRVIAACWRPLFRTTTHTHTHWSHKHTRNNNHKEGNKGQLLHLLFTSFRTLNVGHC